MSTTYIAAFVSLLVIILPKFGINIAAEELTSTIQAVVVAVSSVVIMIRRYRHGDINALGAKSN